MNNTTPTASQKASKFIFTRVSFLTLSWTMGILTALIALRTFVTTLTSVKLDNLLAIYVSNPLFISLTNLGFGVIAFLILLACTLGITSTARNAGRSNFAAVEKNLGLLKAGLIASIFFSVIVITISFASAAVLNITTAKESADSAYYSATTSAVGLFYGTLTFGAIAITLEVSMLRFVMALRRDISDASMGKQGTGLGFVSSLVSSFIMIIAFCVVLFNLVFSDGSLAKLSDKEIASFILQQSVDVLICACLAVLMITICFIVSKYTVYVDNLRRKVNNAAYNAYYGNPNAAAYRSYATPYNSNPSNQPPTYPPYNAANRSYSAVHATIYEGAPVPPASELRSRTYAAAKTTYPASAAASDQQQTDADTAKAPSEATPTENTSANPPAEGTEN